MSAFTATNITRLGYPYHAIRNLKLNMFRLEVKGTATINQASFTYPLLEITTDNDATLDGAREGEYFRIFDGSGNAVLHGIHRRNFDLATHTMYIARMADGQNWFAREIAASLADNYTIESYTVMLPGAFLSRIDETDPTLFYKRGDRELDATNPQTAYPKPQPNMGGAQQADVVSTVATFDEYVGDSVSFLNGNLSYLWDVGTGSITVGTDTDDTITWEIGSGQYYVECRVQDDDIPMASAQRQKRGFRIRYANSATYKAFSDEYDVQIGAITVTTEGASFPLTVYGQDAIDELYTGMPALLSFDMITSQDRYTWVELEQGQGRVYIEGYVKSFREVTSDQRGVKKVVAEIVSPMQYAESLPFADQSLTAVSGTPANWQETTEALMHAGFWQYYAGEYHAPPLFYLHDLYIDEVLDFARPTVSMAGGNVLAAWRSTALLYTGFVTCTRNGQFYCKRDPVMEDDTFRDAIATRWTWTDADVEDDTYVNDNATPGLAYQLSMLLRVGDMSSAATVSSAATFEGHEARYGLFSQGQSPNHGDLSDFIGVDEADIYDRVGHAYQKANARFDVTDIPARGIMPAIVEPAALEWHVLDYGDYDPFVTGLFDAKRTLPVSCRFEIDAENLAVFGGLQVRPETKGKPASEIIRQVATGDGIIPPAVWTYTFDFTVNDGGWYLHIMEDTAAVPNIEAFFAGSTRGAYVASTGWQHAAFTAVSAGYFNNRWGLGIKYDFGTNTTLTRMDFTVIVPGSGSGRSISHRGGYYNDLSDLTYGPRSQATGTVNYTMAIPNVLCESVGLFSQWNSASSGFSIGTLTSVTLAGEGINPFI